MFLNKVRQLVQQLALAMRSFTPDSKANKAIIIITDGENHEDDAVSAAKSAAENGMIVHTIGMGLPQGSPIPVLRNGAERLFKRQSGKCGDHKIG